MSLGVGNFPRSPALARTLAACGSHSVWTLLSLPQARHKPTGLW